jgi:2-keto-3-deoxy-L-fuconate dehydrogenase
VIPTTKHHDGVALWDAPGAGTRNTVHRGPRRDLIGEIADAVRQAGLRFGVYSSGGLDWGVTDFPPLTSHADFTPGRGIGRATVRALRARGAAVASLDLRPLPEPEEDILQIACDVGNDASVREAVAEVVERLGGLDVVVSNAGIGSAGGVEDVTDEEWHQILDINVVGTARLVRAALPHLRQTATTGHAAVVCTGSVAAWTGLVQRTAYSASKGALHALVLAMAADLVREGIRVNAVAPGTADTPWVQRLLAAAPDPDAALAALRARQPTGRLVTAEEVAHAVCYLASPLAGATTGSILQVDGGSHSLVLPPPQ